MLTPTDTADSPQTNLVVCPEPFSSRRQFHRVPADGCVLEAIEACGYTPEVYKHFHVCLDGKPIPFTLWKEVSLHDHKLITIRAVPQGGGGGGGKGILRIVAMIALVAAAIFFAPALAAGLSSLTGLTVSAGFAGGLITAVGGLLINALIPPSVPNRPASPSRTVEQADPLTPSITGVRNQANPYGVIPRIYGKHRVFPPLGATPYTETAGDNQYLILLFLPGYGPLTITDLRIGSTPIAQFTDVTTQIRAGLPGDPALDIYTRDAFEEQLNVQLTFAGGAVSRTTDLATTTISVDITLPRGLVEYNTAGTKIPRAIAVLVEYRVASPPGSWVTAGTISLSRKTSALVRGTLKWDVASDQYDVRLTRQTADATSDQVFDTTFWTALRSFKDDAPLSTTLPAVATIAMRIKATDQLSGVVDSLNCLCEAMVSVYNGASWDANQVTRNPAWAYAHELTGSHNHSAIALSRLDGAELKAWADDCTTEGREYNAVHDSPGTVFERLKTIASVGRASPSLRDGLWTVVRDVAQSTPLQIFSPRNSWDFKGTKTYATIPHAFKVQFLNELAEYQQDERIVYDDGYDEGTASIFETLPLTGITHPDQAWKMGRYFIATARLRPEVYTLSTDMEHLPVTRGDLVWVNHDVMLVGVGSGRVKSVQTSGTDVISITSDDYFLLSLGVSYTLQIRFPNGTITAHAINSPGSTAKFNSFTFTTPIPNTEEQPAVGDFFLIGVTGSESLECVIKSIEPFDGIHARLTLIPAAPGVHTADSGTIPDYDSVITLPPVLTRDIPATPVIRSIRSDESTLRRQADGSLAVQIAIEVYLPSDTNRENLVYQVQYRETGSLGPYLQMPEQTAEVNEVFIYPIDELEQYDIRIRTVKDRSKVSDWTTVVSHVVEGKTNPPPDVATFGVVRQSDGTREFSWTLTEEPPDLEGFQLKWKLGTDGTWSNSTPLHTGLLKASPYETNQLAAGQYTILIKAVDTSGNESSNAKAIISTLGDPRLSGALLQVNCRAVAFPGTKTNCFLSNDGSLHATSEFTWADFGISDGKRSSDSFGLGVTETSNVVPTSP